MTYQITVATAAARPTAVIAATTTWQEFPALWRRLLDQVHASVTWGGPGRKGRNVMLYRDDVPHVEVGVELDQPAEIRGHAVRSTLPPGRVAMTVHRGRYEDLGAAHSAVLRWCAEHGLDTAGPRWEIYGHHHDDPDRRETEVYYLLRAGSEPPSTDPAI
jgi:effector-binding domain-containing protein